MGEAVKIMSKSVMDAGPDTKFVYFDLLPGTGPKWFDTESLRSREIKKVMAKVVEPTEPGRPRRVVEVTLAFRDQHLRAQFLILPREEYPYHVHMSELPPEIDALVGDEVLSWPEPEPVKREHRDGCPDGGGCGHWCGEDRPCFRVQTCSPLSAAKFPGDRWPQAIVRDENLRAVDHG